MKPRKWVLTDVEQGIWLENFETAASGRGKSKARWSIRKRTMRGGLADGVDVVEVDNGVLSFSVLPTRGMGIWRGACSGLALGWRSPVRGPVHPKFVRLEERGGLGWVQGFDELIVRCGLDSNGAPCTDTVTDNNGNPMRVALPLHGRIANSPACRVEVECVPGPRGGPDELAVSGRVEESMLFAPGLALETRISTRVGSKMLVIEDRVINMRSTPVELELLYHCNFGEPFLGGGARLLAPASSVAPRDARAAEGAGQYADYQPPTPGFVEQAYYFKLAGAADGSTLAALVAPGRNRAVAVRFNLNELPCFTLWKNTGALSDGYVTGLEPATNYPNAKPFEREQGRVVRLAPGEERSARLALEVADSPAAVVALEREVRGIIDPGKTVVHAKPQPGLTAGA